MFLEVTRGLSIQDLLRLLNEKLVLESNQIRERETPLPCSFRLFRIRGEDTLIVSHTAPGSNLCKFPGL